MMARIKIIDGIWYVENKEGFRWPAVCNSCGRSIDSNSNDVIVSIGSTEMLYMEHSVCKHN